MDSPLVLVSNRGNEIFEVPGYLMAGMDSLSEPRLPRSAELLPAPEGVTPMILPRRKAVGYNVDTRRMEVISHHNGEEVWAVAGFLPPAYTMTLQAAYKSLNRESYLPLFAYSALGWNGNGFVSAAVRVDPDPRQDPARFNPQRISARIPVMRKKFSTNRLAQHLLDNCCQRYCCPAARNWVLNRWEAPLPTSPSCNAGCLGCISLQENTSIPATQDRLDFVPTVDEIAEIGIEHLNTAPQPVISFGQGCEGEPLLQADLIAGAIRGIRKKTSKGTININTNGYSPPGIEKLCQAGCESFRISVNSFQKSYYERYFSPRNYNFEDVLESMDVIYKQNRWCSVNYFIFPGFTDTREEMQALRDRLKKTPVNMIQMRNLNIDPEWYLSRVLHDYPSGEGSGILEWMSFVKTGFPGIRFGYFNPYLKNTKERK